MDAIIVGRGTAAADDPQLTARPPTTTMSTWRPSRTALRIVVAQRAALSLESRLVRTAREVPVLVAIGPEAPPADCAALQAAGCQMLVCDGPTPQARLEALFDELGRRRMTNVLVEGGGRLLGSLFDARLIDEVHVFIAPKLAGGGAAPGPIAGLGVATISAAPALRDVAVREVAGDVYLQGRIARDVQNA